MCPRPTDFVRARADVLTGRRETGSRAERGRRVLEDIDIGASATTRPEAQGAAGRHDHDVARAVAHRAGELLLALRRDSAAASENERGAEGDRRSHELIVAELATACLGDYVLSEEAAGDPARLTAARVWIVDPLDGTREYREGRDDWAVHVALVVDGRAVASAVALPGLGSALSLVALVRAGPVSTRG